MSRLKHLKKTNEVLSNEEDQEMFERVRATPPTLEFHRKQSLRSQLSKSLTNLDNKQSCPKWFQFTYSPLNQKSKSNTSILIPKSPSGSSCNISRSLQALCVCGNDSPLSSPISPQGLTFIGDIYTVAMGEDPKQPSTSKAFLTKMKSFSMPAMHSEGN